MTREQRWPEHLPKHFIDALAIWREFTLLAQVVLAIPATTAITTTAPAPATTITATASAARPAAPPAATEPTGATAPAEAATTATVFFRPGFVNFQRPAIHIFAIERLNRSLRLFVCRHLDERRGAGCD